MLPDKINPVKKARSKGFAPYSEQMVTQLKWTAEVNSFTVLFASVMRQTSAPRCSRKKYLYFLKKQLVNQRSGFLTQCRNYPVFGLRLLGGDVSEDRPTNEMFKRERLRPNAEGVELPIFMSWYWNRLWELRKVTPNKTTATEVSRILAVLSFSKFLLCDTKNGRRRAEEKYQKRVESLQGKLKNEMSYRDDNPDYLSMVEFLHEHGLHNERKEIKFDRRCYSLKCLVGSKPYRPMVPPAYGLSHSASSIANFGLDNFFEVPNRLVNVIDRLYYSTDKYDGRLQIISESGGKYRGICPYESPYAHSVNLYHRSRTALNRIRGNCNYDQGKGHLIAQSLSRGSRPTVSADASDFSDTIDPVLAVHMAKALGSTGAVHYHSMLRIKLFSNKVIKCDVPLMGWKGTFDLASVLLAYSQWLIIRDRPHVISAMW